MSEYFNRLDKDLERQPMPVEYEKYISHIFCNDCEKKTPAKYHFFYHKCGHCKSFNTTVLKTENTEETQSSDNAVASSSITNTVTATVAATANEESNEALGNSDQDHIMLPQAGGAAGNSTMPPVASYLGIGYMTRNPPPPSSGSSTSSRGRNGNESNEG